MAAMGIRQGSARFAQIVHILGQEVKIMSMISCNCRCNCTLAAIILSALAGILTAFLQVTAVITVAPVFLWVIFGIAVAYLVGLLVAAARCGCREYSECQCDALNTLLVGILGTVLFSLVLLAVGIIATSVLNAIIVGLAVGFFALILTATACLVRTLFDCR